MSARSERAYEWSMSIKYVSAKRADMINYVPTKGVFVVNETITIMSNWRFITIDNDIKQC